MTDLNRSIKKLTQALNLNGQKILYNRRQFMTKDGSIQTMQIVSKAKFNPAKDKYESVDIYKTLSLIRVVLFLRDLLYAVDGKELPTDNDYWNNCREEIKKKEARGIYGGDCFSEQGQIL